MVVVADRSVASPHTARSVTREPDRRDGDRATANRMILCVATSSSGGNGNSMASIFTGTPGNNYW